jgi:hypothetical protein
MTEPDEVRELRELVARMPDIAADADAATLGNDLERLTIDDWARRTIAAAHRANRPDVVDKVEEILQGLDAVDDRAAEETQRRRGAAAHARDVLKRIDGDA